MAGLAGLTIDQRTRTVTVPSNAALGAHTITATATDEDGADWAVSRQFQLTVESAGPTAHAVDGEPAAFDLAPAVADAEPVARPRSKSQVPMDLGGGRYGWGGGNRLNLPIPSQWLATPSNTALLTNMIWNSAGGMEIRTVPSAAGAGPGAPGPDFSDAVEAGLVIRLTQGANVLTVRGIAGDSTEPYAWTPANSAEVIAFHNATNFSDPITVRLSFGAIEHAVDGQAAAFEFAPAVAAATEEAVSAHRVDGQAAGFDLAPAQAAATDVQTETHAVDADAAAMDFAPSAAGATETPVETHQVDGSAAAFDLAPAEAATTEGAVSTVGVDGEPAAFDLAPAAADATDVQTETHAVDAEAAALEFGAAEADATHSEQGVAGHTVDGEPAAFDLAPAEAAATEMPVSETGVRGRAAAFEFAPAQAAATDVQTDAHEVDAQAAAFLFAAAEAVATALTPEAHAVDARPAAFEFDIGPTRRDGLRVIRQTVGTEFEVDLDPPESWTFGLSEPFAMVPVDPAQGVDLPETHDVWLGFSHVEVPLAARDGEPVVAPDAFPDITYWIDGLRGVGAGEISAANQWKLSALRNELTVSWTRNSPLGRYLALLSPRDRGVLRRDMDRRLAFRSTGAPATSGLGDGQALPTFAFAGSRSVEGVWAQDGYLYAVDETLDRVLVYEIASGLRQESREFALDSLNRRPRGVWSDGTALYVCDSRSPEHVFVYTLATGARDATKEPPYGSSQSPLVLAGNVQNVGIWSDGTTVWIVDQEDQKIYAYTLSNWMRDAANDIALPDIGQPWGMWMNVMHVYVTRNRDVADGKIWAFTRAGARVSGLDIPITSGYAGQAYVTVSGDDTLWYAGNQNAARYSLSSRVPQTEHNILATAFPVSVETEVGEFDFRSAVGTDVALGYTLSGTLVV